MGQHPQVFFKKMIHTTHFFSEFIYLPEKGALIKIFEIRSLRRSVLTTLLYITYELDSFFYFLLSVRLLRIHNIQSDDWTHKLSTWVIRIFFKDLLQKINMITPLERLLYLKNPLHHISIAFLESKMTLSSTYFYYSKIIINGSQRFVILSIEQVSSAH